MHRGASKGKKVNADFGRIVCSIIMDHSTT